MGTKRAILGIIVIIIIVWQAYEVGFKDYLPTELPKIELPEVEIPNIFPAFDSSRIESLVFQYTNEERVKHGLPSLKNDKKL